MRYILLSIAFLPLFFTSAYGDSVNEVDSFSIPYSSYNSFAQVDSDTIVLAHAGGGQTEHITTFDIDSNNIISQITTLKHETAFTHENSIYKLKSGIFVLTYNIAGSDGAGKLKTFDISNDGTTITELNEYDFTTHTKYSSITQVDSGVVVVSYYDDDNDGQIKTFDISSNGNITELNIFEYDINRPTFGELLQLDSDTIVLAYYASENNDNDGYIKTFDISASGIITETNSLLHGLAEGYHSLVKVDSNTIALAYTEIITASGETGIIKTFDIDSDGITITELNKFVFDDIRPIHISMVELAPNNFALVYTRSVGFDGMIKIMEITNSGNIIELSSLEHEPLYALTNAAVKVNSNTVAMAHSYHDSGKARNFIKTFTTLPIIKETPDFEQINGQLELILSQLSSLTNLVTQNINDITNLQTQIDNLPTEENEEPPVEPITYYITDGTSNLFMCTPVKSSD